MAKPTPPPHSSAKPPRRAEEPLLGAPALISRAKAAFTSGDFQTSATWFEAALRESNCAERHLVLCNRSAALLKLRRLAEALADADEAACLCPTFVKAHYRRAQALSAMEEHDLAAVACARALELQPDNEQIIGLLRSCEHACFQTRASAALPSPPLGGSEQASQHEAGTHKIAEDHSHLACRVRLTRPSRDDNADACDGPDYLDWCRKTAARLASEGEHGQACAWFGHALSAVMPEGTSTNLMAHILADRAASLLQLGRFADAVHDCRRAVSMCPSLTAAHVRGSVALLHLGRMSEAESFAAAALASVKVPQTAREERIIVLRSLSVRELRGRLRKLHGANLGSSEAPILDKDDLVRQVEQLERAVDASEASMQAQQAVEEVAVMRERVSEIEWMARSCEWRQVLEHTAWLMREYPLHSALRMLRLSALTALTRVEEAAQLCEEMLQRTPEDAGVLYFKSWFTFDRSGVAAAEAALTTMPLEQAEYSLSAELLELIRTVHRTHVQAQERFHRGAHHEAVVCACEALALAEGSAAARLPLFVLIASALVKLERHLEAVSMCDSGLRLFPWGSGSEQQTREQERLLLRRAGCFLVLDQPAQALSDYRSALKLNERNSQAASGVLEAWRALQNMHSCDTLYEVLGVHHDASETELKRAYRQHALRWHPDKHVRSDDATRVEADIRFRQLQNAWTVLSNAETRELYDSELKEHL
ncbi:hypothetical protein AB1Y20_014533 [Prymnesium parvum]|uniref:J domain-containing protein n=1 Tax=Prymnesium parvum TaxID=97485 RepID=A0AB34IEA0_PRYPA